MIRSSLRHSVIVPIALLALGGPGAAAAFDDHYGCWHCRVEAFADEATPTPGYDPVTGRDLKNYPPHRVVDHLHMKLVIDIPDMNTPELTAVQTLTVLPIAEPVSRLTLNAELLEIQDVSVAGHETRFTHEDGVLSLAFDPPLPVDQPADIVTRFRAVDPPQGLTWTPESAAWPGRPAQLHTQGQPETNRYWFPCHDFPNERLTTELVVTVPAGFEVSSNGRLLARRKSDGGARETFHWLQDKPHVNYLVSLVVGKFDVVDVGTGRRGDLPMPVYAPPGRGGDVAGTYGRTRRMVDLFAKLVDEPYPWDRYAQLIVWNFGAGGMENTAATTMYDTAIFSPEALAENDLDGLIAHELAHQWFGDLITCNSWEHIWLNEGFATFFSLLWFEHRDGADAYQAALTGSFDGVVSNDRAEAPRQPGMASKVYDEPWDVFRRKANPYPKGASVLHMLRQRVGDELFFKSIAVYVDRFKGRTVETNDLRRVFEEVTGESLERFFDQWVRRPGVPQLDVAIEWDDAASELVVSVEQTQNIDGDNPAFAFSLPLWVSGAEPGRRIIEVDQKSTVVRIPLDAAPAFVAVDPGMAVLAGMTIEQPAEAWLRQLERGPTYAARVQAVRALARDDSPASAEALLTLALDEAGIKDLRAEAVRALGRRGQTERLLNVLSQEIAETDVLVAAVEALADAAKDEPTEAVRSTLLRYAGPGPSERARVAAIRALGKLGVSEALPELLGATEAESQHDRVRQAALDALADLGAAEGLAAAIRCAQPGHLNRTRPAAIGAIARLASHDPDLAYETIVALLNDRERRAWDAAGRALVELRDARGIEPLRTLAAAKRDAADRRLVERWIEDLQAKLTPEPAASGG